MPIEPVFTPRGQLTMGSGLAIQHSRKMLNCETCPTPILHITGKMLNCET